MELFKRKQSVGINATARIFLWIVYIASVSNDLFIIKGSSWKLALDIATIFILTAISIYLYTKISKVSKQSWRKNLPFVAYVFLLITVQILFHNLDLRKQLVLFAYIWTGSIAYVLLPAILEKNAPLLIEWMRVVAFTSCLISFTAILSNIGFRDFFGLTFANKFGAYSFGFVHATGGILEHPLTLGAQSLLGIGSSLYLLKDNKHLSSFILISINMAGLFLAFSRGAWVAAIIGVAITFIITAKRPSKPVLKALLLILFMLSVQVYGLLQANLIHDILRLDYGTSGRDILWTFAATLISKEPLTGYGLLSPAELKVEFGDAAIRELAADSGFHNNFIDSALESGLIVATTYFLLFVIPIIRLSKSPMAINYKRGLLFLGISMLIASLFVNYNIGGIRSTSLAMTVFLGVANLSKK